MSLESAKVQYKECLLLNAPILSYEYYPIIF